MSLTDAQAQEILAIRSACLAGDGIDPIDQAVMLRLTHHRETLDALIRPSEGFLLRDGGQAHLAVAPSARGRGVASDLATGLIGPVEAWSHGNHPAAARLAARHGLRRTRDLWVLRIDAADVGPVDSPSDNHIVVRTWRPSDTAQLLRVNASAFAQHPEQGQMDLAELQERMAEPWFDPAGLFMAYDGSVLLGFHWTKRHSADLGEVHVVAVDPAAQGRGLAKMLVSLGVRHLVDLGVKEVILYVEADNPVAVGLYERLGFRHAAADTHVLYSRQ